MVCVYPVWYQVRDLLAVVGSLALGHAMLYSVQGSLIPELFGTRLRYTGASIGYQLAAPFAGALTDFVERSQHDFEIAQGQGSSAWPSMTKRLLGAGRGDT